MAGETKGTLWEAPTTGTDAEASTLADKVAGGSAGDVHYPIGSTAPDNTWVEVIRTVTRDRAEMHPRYTRDRAGASLPPASARYVGYISAISPQPHGVEGEKGDGYWFYRAPGNGVWLNTGKTIVIEDTDDTAFEEVRSAPRYAPRYLSQICRGDMRGDPRRRIFHINLE